MLSLSLSQNQNNSKLHKLTFETFYAVVKGLFAIRPTTREKMEYPIFRIRQYIGYNKIRYFKSSKSSPM